MSLNLVSEFQNKSVDDWRSEISDAISAHGTLKAYERKRVIFVQGAPSRTVYAIRSGLVEVSALNESGHEVTSSIRGVGQPFGWSEGLLREPRARQASVLQDAEIWELGIEEFLKLLIDRPEIMLAALGSAVHRATRTVEMRSKLRGAHASDRVGYVLRRLAGSEGGVATPHLRITHDEISRVCELSRQTVTTILGHMQRNGIVELGLRSITILKPERLERSAAF
jgi:CRP-like cAMP-binding protein